MTCVQVRRANTAAHAKAHNHRLRASCACRTSEVARLFGADCFLVLAKGSQYRNLFRQGCVYVCHSLCAHTAARMCLSLYKNSVYRHGRALPRLLVLVALARGDADAAKCAAMYTHRWMYVSARYRVRIVVRL